MLLTDSYKSRISELAGVEKTPVINLLKEFEDLYANSGKRVKFDMNIMKQAIEGGLEVGLVFQSNNSKYKMPIWKMRVVQPVAMGFNKGGELVIRGIHVEGQSEKKAIETGVRSAEAKNEWRLFKASNIKSMFFTGRKFTSISLQGYNPNDSAMTSIIAHFEPSKAANYQKQLSTIKKNPTKPVVNPVPLKEPKNKPLPKVTPKPAQQPAPKPQTAADLKRKEDIRKLKDKINKLNKLL